MITDYLNAYTSGIYSNRIYYVGRIYPGAGECIAYYEGINYHNLRAIHRVFFTGLRMMPGSRTAT